MLRGAPVKSAHTVEIKQRFCGPPNSGNGGYSCGIIGKNLSGPSQVRLHRPPPLDQPLTLSQEGDNWSLKHQGQLVGSAQPTELNLLVPTPPSLTQARAARSAYPKDLAHVFSTCFVCGPDRDAGDGLRLFCGSVGNSYSEVPLVACDWQPDAALLDAQGNVAAEYIWSALDCPSYFALGLATDKISLLAQMSCSIDRPVQGNQPLIVFAWKRYIDGRKGFSGAALANAQGDILARAEHVWIELK
jgi:hypothetical protein